LKVGGGGQIFSLKGENHSLKRENAMVGRRAMSSDTPDITSEQAGRTLDTPATLPNTPDPLPDTPDLARDRPAVPPGHQSGTSESRSLTSDYSTTLGTGENVSAGSRNSLYLPRIPMWKQHIVICASLALLAIPLYVADSYLLKGSGGGWISLDMTGLIIIPYIAFAATHVVVSSLGLFFIPSTRPLSLHILSGITSVGLLVLGFIIYTAYDRAQDAASYEKRMKTVEQLKKVIELRDWRYEPSDDAPKEIRVRVKVNEAGRFSGNAEGRAEGNPGEMIFNTEDTPQRQASKGEEFSMALPLHFLKEGRADSVSITLYLFKDETGTAPEDVTIIFEENPKTDYDGQFIYAQIPPPARR
jgi:hypothetical protein